MQAENHPRAPRRHRSRRDRHGRGLRAPLAPRGVPLSRTPGERFDDLVLDAVDDLEVQWTAELRDVEFAVEDVPEVPVAAGVEYDPEVVSDHGVPLGRLYRSGLEPGGKPLIVIYRRPVEARAPDREDRDELVFAVVTELVAELLGKDIDEIDPPPEG